MKSILASISIVALLLCTTSEAVSQTLRLHFKNGTTQSFEYSAIDSMVVVPAEPVSPNFEISISDIKSTRITATVSCDNPDVPYFFDLCTDATYQKYGGDMASLIHSYIADIQRTQPQLTIEQIVAAMRDTGTVTEQISGLPAATDMWIYVMALGDDGVCYGKAATLKFTTLEAGDPAKCEFDIEASDIGATDCVINIKPSDPSTLYWYGLVRCDGYPGDYAMMATVQAELRKAAESYGMDLDKLVERVGYRDDISMIESGLEPETAYYVYAYALKTDGSNAGQLTKNQFKTATTDVSDANISVAYRYFDGNELYDADPDTYSRYKDAVMVEVHVTPEGSAANWIFAIGAGDMTDPDIYPDESTKNAMLQGGSINKTDMTFVARWGQATMLYFAADENGIDGQLCRELVEFTKQGASPISELTAPAFSIRAAAVPLSVNSAKAIKLPAAKSGYRNR